MSKFTKILLVFLFNLLLILILLYGVEFFLNFQRLKRESLANFKVNDQKVIVTKEGWGVLKGKIVSTWGHPVFLSNFGIGGDFYFRQKPFKIPKPEGLFRIVALGDSFTWGTGMPEENRYTNILEKLLNNYFPARKFEVLNLSVLGASTVQERNILFRMKGILQPDLIIIGFCINDPKPGPQGFTPERAKFEKKVKPSLDKISKFMNCVGLPNLSILINDSIFRLAEIFNIIPTWQEAVDRTYNPKSQEWNEFLKALRDIKRFTDELGLPSPIFAVLNHGTSTTQPTEFSNPNRELRLYLKWWHQAERSAKKKGFITCNMEEDIKRYLSKEPLGVNKWDAHPSPKLHEIYANRIFSLICDIIKNSKGDHR